jgi:hypothetical protein
MRWLPLVAAALACGACVDMEDGSSPIVGTSGDVTLEPGDYVGYRVVSPCVDGHVHIGVIGTGSRQLTEIAAIKDAARELGSSLGDVASVWGHSGYGLSCEPGIGTQIYTNNWQDVDALVVRAGEFLRDRDLALQVGIAVAGMPVAHR